MKISKLFLPKLCFLAGILLIAALPVRAFAEVDQKADAQKAESKTVELPQLSSRTAKDIESKGLYSNRNDGALSNNMWRGSKRSDLVKLIKNLPEFPHLPAMQRLYKGILLSKADAGEIQNDIEIENGEDLFTLRLEKLLEYGLYNKASRFYALLDQKPYSAKLARAGLLSYLLNRESSLACLELQIAKETLETDDEYQKFLTKIDTYCEALLASELPDETKTAIEAMDDEVLKKALLEKDYRFLYTPADFGKLSLFTKAVLTASDKLDMEKIPDISSDKIPSVDLLILYQHPETTTYRKLHLAGEAVSRGIMNVSEITDLYKGIALPVTGNSRDEAGLQSTEKLALYLKQAGRSRGKERREYIDKALKMKDTFGLYALTPFADYMQYEDWSMASGEELVKIVKLLHTAGLSIPGDFTKWLAAKLDSEKKNTTLDQAYLASIVSSQHALPDNEKDKINGIFDNYDRQTQHFLKSVMKIFDNNMANDDNADKVYENGLDLTLFIDYVMPSHNVWKRLDMAEKKDAIAETVLWSTYVFRDQPPKDIYPALWHDVLHGLNAVGLNTFSKELAVSALLAEKE